MQNKTTIEIEKPIVPQWFDEWYKTFNNGGNKAQALYYLNRTGWGHALIDGNECEVEGYYEELHTLFGYSGYEDAKEYLSKAIIVGYEVEQPLHYAKIKGWELTRDKQADMYWVVDKQDNKLLVDSSPVIIIDRLGGECGYVTKLTIEEWNNLGINGKNADFEKVEQ